jgi:caa(3)-type oxidase subunit IV
MTPGKGETVEHTEETQHHPISVYLKVWGLLFVLSTMSYFVDFFEVQVLLKRFLITAFALMKAGLIVSYFMHMRFERLSLVYAILLPPLLLIALVGIMAAEGDYVAWLRQLVFGRP